MFENILYIIAFSLILLFVLIFIYFYIIIPNRHQLLEECIEKELYDDAEAIILDIIKKEPNNIKVLYMLAQIYWKNNRIEEAVEIYETIIEQHTIPIEYIHDVYFNLSSYYNELKKYTLAIPLIEKLLSMDPKNEGYLLFLGKIYKNMGDLKSSIKTLQKAANINPKNSDTLKSIGESYYSLQMYTNAYNSFSLAAELNPKNPDIWFQLGETSEIINDLNKAMGFYTKVEQMYDLHYRFLAVKKISNLHLIMNNKNLYIQYLEKAKLLIAENHTYPFDQQEILDVFYKLGDAYLENHRTALALEEWGKILEIDKSYLDTQEKYHTHYQSKLDDLFKDMITESGAFKIDLLSDFIKSLGYSIYSTQTYSEDAIDFFALEISGKLRELNKKRTVFSFWCSTEPFPMDIAIRLSDLLNAQEHIFQLFIISAGPILSEIKTIKSNKLIQFFDRNNIQDLINARKNTKPKTTIRNNISKH